MEIFEVNKMCRICLEENELISLFELSMDPPPFQMIMNIANVQVRFFFLNLIKPQIKKNHKIFL